MTDTASGPQPEPTLREVMDRLDRLEQTLAPQTPDLNQLLRQQAKAVRDKNTITVELDVTKIGKDRRNG